MTNNTTAGQLARAGSEHRKAPPPPPKKKKKKKKIQLQLPVQDPNPAKPKQTKENNKHQTNNKARTGPTAATGPQARKLEPNNNNQQPTNQRTKNKQQPPNQQTTYVSPTNTKLQPKHRRNQKHMTSMPVECWPLVMKVSEDQGRKGKM
jgi:hypothetical protein